jgi:hypothetical protein
MRSIPLYALICLLVASATARAQTPSDLQILFGGYELNDDGGEKAAGIWLGTGSLGKSKSTSGTYSFGDCGAFMLSGGNHGEIREHAHAAWKVQATVVRIVGDAVTFRLQWSRFLDNGKPSTAQQEDVELTLRPGQSRPLDTVAVPSGAKAMRGGPCRTRAVSIRVQVETYPSEDFDRRLVAVNLWLVERLANGTERSQPLTVRGLPHRHIPFYFESIVDRNVSLDIFGRVMARTGGSVVSVSLVTRSRWSEDWGRSLDSSVEVQPQEVVEVRLPRLDAEAGPFANRDFSIRLRVDQLR